MSRNDKLQELDDLIKKFNTLVQKNLEETTKNTKQLNQEIGDIQDELEEKVNIINSKLEELKKQQSFWLTVQRLAPALPANFPKNFEIVFIYQDIALTGNQRFLDFQEDGEFNEKFIAPLLEVGSQKIRLEIWECEQDKSLFDSAEFELQKYIEEAVDSSTKNTTTFSIPLKGNPTHTLSINLILKGIGFEAWVKNLQLQRETQEQLNFGRKQRITEADLKRKVAKEKIAKFNMKFNEREKLKKETGSISYDTTYSDLNNLLQQLRTDN